jgi:molybdate transport system ATP-binding protein
VLTRTVTNEFVVPEKRGVGVVFQDYLLFEHLTVSENVGFGLRSRGFDKSTTEPRVGEWLDRMGLTELADQRARDLSGGESQRVALARALITEPELLLLDEPMAALDATSRVGLRRELADHLKEFAGPRLLITHDPTEAFLLADLIYVVEEGRITQSGPADDIRLRPKTAYAADLAGSNLVVGVARGGDVDVGGHVIHVADLSISGDVLATIHPRAVAVYPVRPDGSPRNTWETTVTRVEHFGDRVRLQTGPPLALAVEVTPESVQVLELTDRSRVWVSIKATEIGVEPR